MKIKASLTILLAMIIVAVGMNTRDIRDMQVVSVTAASPDIRGTLSACVIITDNFGHGSGVAIAPNLILTAGHCTGYPGSYVIGSDGEQYDIISEWKSDKYDIGFVLIDGAMPCLSLSDMPELLDEVYLMGAPNDIALQSTISKGIVSNINVDCYVWLDVLIVDAASWGGDSGGPLLNADFEIIGMCVGGPDGACSITICEPITHIREALEDYLNAVPK